MYTRDLTITGTFNARDLGGYSTPMGHTAWRKTFRSGSLSHLSESGQRELANLGITRVIDLRSQKERHAEPDLLGDGSTIELISIPLFDDLDPQNLPTGNRLLGLYIKALTEQGETFVHILRQIASSQQGVLFHCSLGKDRTGLVTALLLGLTGVEDKDIVADYALTASRIQPLLAQIERSAKVLAIKPEDYEAMLACDPDTMRQTLAWLTEHYHGISDYLAKHGLKEEEQLLLIQRITTGISVL